ncbi:MAG: L-histidine N(alpha)-methyltransferase, partial [Planctomycetota bacterium]
LPTAPSTPQSTAVYFPGSTIGNFEREQAVKLLESMAKIAGPGGSVLIGVDLVKEVTVLESAYDDKEGVTASFNLNLLHRIKHELGAELSEQGFAHEAFFEPEESRIEIYLRSLREQTITLEDRVFHLNEGERIHTEYSHKYSVDGFTKMAERAGFVLEHLWTDADDYFAVIHLRQPTR